MGISLQATYVDTAPDNQNDSVIEAESTISNSIHRRGAKSLSGNYSINIDKQKISQVVRNLLSNALKFTPKGGRVEVTARIVHVPPEDYNCTSTSRSRGLEPSHECSLSPPYFRLEVTDTGPGVAKVRIHFECEGVDGSESLDSRKCLGNEVEVYVSFLLFWTTLF